MVVGLFECTALYLFVFLYCSILFVLQGKGSRAYETESVVYFSCDRLWNVVFFYNCLCGLVFYDARRIFVFLEKLVGHSTTYSIGSRGVFFGVDVMCRRHCFVCFGGGIKKESNEQRFFVNH